jgi:hypothetical protein
MRMKLVLRLVVVAVAFLFVVFSACFAQSAPTPLPGYNIQISAGYSLLSGAQNNNGMFASVAVPIWTRNSVNTFTVSGRADYFTVTSPSVYVVTAGPEVRYQFSRASILGGMVFQPFGNMGMGTGRSSCVNAGTCTATSSAGASHFAFKFGGGLDVPVSSTLTMRVFEVDWIHSTLFPGNSLTLTNVPQVTSGISLRF